MTEFTPSTGTGNNWYRHMLYDLTRAVEIVNSKLRPEADVELILMHPDDVDEFLKECNRPQERAHKADAENIRVDKVPIIKTEDIAKGTYYVLGS